MPSFLHAEGLTVEVAGLGEITVDVAYGGNFYAIVEPQKNFRDMADIRPAICIALEPGGAAALNEKYDFVHPGEPGDQRAVATCCGPARRPSPSAHARNAVFYGDKAIDRSPCGTGTSARMAQLGRQGQAQGRRRVRARDRSSARCSRAGSRSDGVAGKPAIIPSIGGWARMTGLNTIFIDDRDPFAHGFLVKDAAELHGRTPRREMLQAKLAEACVLEAGWQRMPGVQR